MDGADRARVHLGSARLRDIGARTDTDRKAVLHRFQLVFQNIKVFLTQIQYRARLDNIKMGRYGTEENLLLSAFQLRLLGLNLSPLTAKRVQILATGKKLLRDL